MKIITPGQNELANFEKEDTKGQILQFIQKEGEPLKTIHDGTTNEEVLEMLIDRLESLVKLPSTENVTAVGKCEQALQALRKRTADRKERGVGGTNKP